MNVVGEILQVNQRFCQMTGYCAEKLLGTSLENIIYLEDRCAYQKALKHLLNNQLKICTLEQRYLKEDNSYFWINLTVSLVHKANGEPEYLMGIVEDISERKKTEHSLVQANQQLKKIIEQLARQNRERTLLSRVSQYLQSCQNIEEAYNILADLLQPLFEGSSIGIYQLNEAKNKAQLVSQWGENHLEEFDCQDCWSLRQGKAHYAEENCNRLFCSHTHSNSELKATLCYPMTAQGTIFGLL